MADAPVMEPKLQQAMNDTQVADLFKTQRGARVIQMRPRTGMGDAPVSRTATNALPATDPKAVAAAQAAARAAQAAAAAQEAAKAAAEAQAVATRAAQVQQRIANEQPPVQTMQAQAPGQDEPYRVPVKRRSSPFVLLGVAAAALFGAVAWSMMETYGPKKLEGVEDEEEEEELDAPSLSGHRDVIEGEIVEDEESDDEEQVA